MSRSTAIAALCLALLTGLAAPAALADDDDDRRISLDEAVAQAERRYDARVVRAEEKRSGDRIYYRIRLLGSDGRVFEVTIDAGSGDED